MSKPWPLLGFLSVFCAFALIAFQVHADAIDVITFDNDADRTRYQKLATELRCPRCQNQNLIDSNSQIAIDLRREVARLVKDGKSDKEVKDFLVARYGDFVLYEPPVQENTIVLWVAPLIMASLGVLTFCIILLRRARMGSSKSIDSDPADSPVLDTSDENGDGVGQVSDASESGDSEEERRT